MSEALTSFSPENMNINAFRNQLLVQIFYRLIKQVSSLVSAIGFQNNPPLEKGGEGGFFKSNKFYLTMLRRFCDGEFSLSFESGFKGFWYSQLSY